MYADLPGDTCMRAQGGKGIEAHDSVDTSLHDDGGDTAPVPAAQAMPPPWQDRSLADTWGAQLQGDAIEDADAWSD